MSRTLSWLLSLAALALLCFLCIRWKAPQIEADITERTNATLADAGHGFASAEVDGRDVRLVGTAPSEELRAAALANARDVWGARVVTDGMTLAVVPETPDAEAVAPTEPEQEVAEPAVDREAECRRRMADAIGSDEIHFAFDRADLPANAPGYLDRIAAVAADCRMLRLDLRGNTDAQGTDDYNVGLSERRVAAVRRYLVSAGVTADRMQTEALGEREPIDTNATAAGRANNRRVDIRLIGAQP